MSVVLPHGDLLCSGLVHVELGLEVHVVEVWHGGVEVVEDLRESDGVDGGLPVLLRQIHHSRPKRHLDFDERLVTVGQQILGLP